MEYIAKDSGTTRHAVIGYRERIYLEKAHVWGWAAHTRCGRTIEGTSSGGTIAEGIGCKRCRQILRGNGWTI